MTLRVFCLALLALPALAGETRHLRTDQLPPDVRPFVAKDTRPLAVSGADLNGDGREDFVLVLESQKPIPGDDDLENRARLLLILVRRPDGALKEVKRNDKVVYCLRCGGMMGDPFQDVLVGPKGFIVSNAGGSAWRWSAEYEFGYSRRDDTWQLVRVEESSFHATDPDKVRVSKRTPPRHYGKIDIADFDPDKWKGQGRK